MELLQESRGCSSHSVILISLVLAILIGKSFPLPFFSVLHCCELFRLLLAGSERLPLSTSFTLLRLSNRNNPHSLPVRLTRWLPKAGTGARDQEELQGTRERW